MSLVAGVSPPKLDGGWGCSVPVARRLRTTNSRGDTGFLCDCVANHRLHGAHPAGYRITSWQARVHLFRGKPHHVELGKQSVQTVCVNRLLQINTDSRWPSQVIGVPAGAYGEQWPAVTRNTP